MSNNFHEMITKLNKYWSDNGCYIAFPYSSEVGAGTFNPFTFLNSLGNKEWKIAYTETSKRPKDGRYNENPLRFQQFTQYQVLLKPAPSDTKFQYLNSLEAIGINILDHDIRFVEDDWDSPTLGASGLGWEVWIDGTEITQFTYFQQIGGIDLSIIPVELTYGLERIALFLQKKDCVQDLDMGGGKNWQEIFGISEKQWCIYNFDKADVNICKDNFNIFESESLRLLDEKLVYPAYDFVIKCSHLFNILDARGAISPNERAGYIKRVRKLAKLTAQKYIDLETQIKLKKLL